MRSFAYMYSGVFIQLYKALIRPLLEYATWRNKVNILTRISKQNFYQNVIKENTHAQCGNTLMSEAKSKRTTP